MVEILELRTFSFPPPHHFLVDVGRVDASSPENLVIPTEARAGGQALSQYPPLPRAITTKNPSLISDLIYNHIKVFKLMTFFDSLLEDFPATPTYYDGEYSFSSQPGAYHIIAGLVTDGVDDYTYFCAKRTNTTFVRISPPMTLKEAIQITSKYAKFWVSVPPGSNLEERRPPDEYCKFGFLLSMGEGGGSRFLDFSYQVFKDWVSFSGRTSEPSRVEVIIKRLDTMEVVKTLSTETSGSSNSFYLATSLEPGDYTYEACPYPL